MEESILKERFEDFSLFSETKTNCSESWHSCKSTKKNIAKNSSLQFCIILIFHQLDEHYVNIY